ncbi:PQQ-binding-like beta-propeller repeat protein [Brachybacterium sp. ACRRE]|uniref:outer membrane protein assembly factor BamB family protein n=1 Tax=Brachybacterium sp. ACRRE TaxID=2918184 RepID=UPI001EF26167|nr:PQQ-binding-like beta-propeller repeat protein [Brachybacterium sp. ACRRE]MCG7310800.1 PQQ-binding-like beta-propeller repeat protein [Brachybacterium sp. ACRRE]
MNSRTSLPSTHHDTRAGITRRSALASVPALASVGAGAGAAHAAPIGTAAAPGSSAPAKPSRNTKIKLVFLADSHADPENTESMARLRAVMQSVEEFDPELVIHGGDVTEHGTAAEFDAFDEAIPDDLRDRIVAVPGNHEARWDATGGHRRHARIGADVRIKDVSGLRLILADTTTHQQEVAWWPQQSLDDLEDALHGSAKMPRILVTHFPMGVGYYYVANQQAFEDVVAKHPIPLHLTGHTHRELLTRVNRRDQLEAAAVKIDAAYYELTGTIDSLDVTRVTIPDPSDPATQERTRVTTYDLRPSHGKDPVQPRSVDAGGAGSSVRVDVKLPGSFDGAVEATFYDTSVYAGRNDELAWTSLSAGRGGRFTGSLDAADLSAGRERVHVRVRPDDGTGDRLLTVPFRHGRRGTAWERELGGTIQSGSAVMRHRGEDVLVVASSSGKLLALDSSGRTVWSRRPAHEVRHDLAVVDGGAGLIVPDLTGRILRLGPDGSKEWTYSTQGPCAADPGIGRIGRKGRETRKGRKAGENEPSGNGRHGAAEAVLICAGSTLHAIDADFGRKLWASELPAPSMGAPACDGERVFVGAGDGCVHALDADTGEELWATSITDKAGSYQRFIYGPWNDAVQVLEDGGVIVSGITDAQCLSPEDGSVRWRVEGSFQYAREAVTEDGDLLLANEGGELVRVDPATGEEKARYATAERILDEGFVLEGGVAYAASHSGLVTAVHLDSGEIEQLTRLGDASVLAPGAAVGDVVAFGDLAGNVRAVDRV